MLRSIESSRVSPSPSIVADPIVGDWPPGALLVLRRDFDGGWIDRPVLWEIRVYSGILTLLTEEYMLRLLAFFLYEDWTFRSLLLNSLFLNVLNSIFYFVLSEITWLLFSLGKVSLMTRFFCLLLPRPLIESDNSACKSEFWSSFSVLPPISFGRTIKGLLLSIELTLLCFLHAETDANLFYYESSSAVLCFWCNGVL